MASTIGTRTPPRIGAEDDQPVVRTDDLFELRSPRAKGRAALRARVAPASPRAFDVLPADVFCPPEDRRSGVPVPPYFFVFADALKLKQQVPSISIGTLSACACGLVVTLSGCDSASA